MREAALTAHRALSANENAARAAESARDAYQNLADIWYETQTIEGQVHAAAANSNAGAIGVKGTATARIVRIKEENRGRVKAKKEIQ
jgi:hypothetical protein